MKRLYSTQISGRREGEEPEWKFSPSKLAVSICVPIATAVIIGWVGWVSVCSIAGDAAKNKVDQQLPVMWGKFTAQDAKRDDAVKTITKKIDDNQAAQTVQYQQIMNQLLQMQRDINK